MRNMLDVAIIGVVLGGLCLAYLFVYRRAEVECQMTDHHLVLRMRIVGFIRCPMRFEFGTIRGYELLPITRALRLCFADNRWPIILGNIHREVVLLRLTKGVHRTVIVSPRDPDALMAALRSALPSADTSL